MASTERILIWGKTYPELSTKYIETVCTGGVREDGSPVRLYPIEFRYLEGDAQFHNYQWIEANIERNTADPRPESFRPERGSIKPVGEPIPSTRNDQWGARAEVVFKDPSWQFSSVEDLWAAQSARRTSLGVVTPKSIDSVEMQERSPEDYRTFQEKLDAVRAKIAFPQFDLFEQSMPLEVKHLEYVAARPLVRWHCHGPDCKGHSMQVLDWGVLELARKAGEPAALAKLREVLDTTRYDVRLFLGNFVNHQANFAIVGIWYPKRSDQAPLFGRQ